MGSHASIGDGALLAEGSYVGDGVKLGKHVTIGPRVVVANAVIGDGSHIDLGTVFTGFREGKIWIGNESYVGIYTVLDWSGGVRIGSYVHIAGPSTGIWTHSSVNQALLGDELEQTRRKYTGEVQIGDCVYIGGNSTIYPSVTIGTHAVVAPNSAVNRSVPSETLVGGVPACPLRRVMISGSDVTFLPLENGRD